MLPGGTASAIAHLIGVPLVLATGWTIAGTDLWVVIGGIAALAMLLLYGCERDRRGRSRAGAGAAVLTVLASDIGMGG